MDDLLSAFENLKPHKNRSQRALSEAAYPQLPSSGGPLTYQRPSVKSVGESPSPVGDSASNNERKEKATADLKSETGKQKAKPDDNEPIQYTQRQKDAINRILECHDEDYYGILDLPPTCSTEAVKKRFHDLSLITHPDKNKFQNAKVAFNKIKAARQVLTNQKERANYDKQGKKYKGKKALFDEEFHLNAYGGDSDDSGGGIEEHANEDGYDDGAKPYQAILKIYHEATPHIQSIFRIGSLDPRAEKYLNRYNKKIIQKNRKRGLPDNKFRINYEVLVTNMKMAAGHLSKLESNPNDENAIQWVASFHNMIKGYIKDNNYPSSWMVRSLGKQTTGPPRASARGGGELPGIDPILSDIEMSDAHSLAGSLIDDASMRTAPVSIPEHYNRPGYTSDGHRILGYSPVYKTDRRTRQVYFSHAYFVVEQPTEPNPIKLLSSGDLGYQATDNYLELPEDEKVDISDNSVRKNLPQAKDFIGILGFASNPIGNHDEDAGVGYIRGYVLARFADGDGEYRIIMSRVMLRQVLGPKMADKTIDKFFVKLDETAPWEVPPKRISEGRRSDITWGQKLGSGQLVRRKSRGDLDYYESEYSGSETEFSDASTESETSEGGAVYRKPKKQDKGRDKELFLLKNDMSTMMGLMRQLMINTDMNQKQSRLGQQQQSEINFGQRKRQNAADRVYQDSQQMDSRRQTSNRHDYPGRGQYNDKRLQVSKRHDYMDNNRQYRQQISTGDDYQDHRQLASRSKDNQGRQQHRRPIMSGALQDYRQARSRR
ncbi:hypothetical protein O988_02063 [Pseudogymnoascus sp. VKM F-3808]|nr:hypothetical protein O988_02063 [Pseudogymnoascus sp. VKM F-3808]